MEPIAEGPQNSNVGCWVDLGEESIDRDFRKGFLGTKKTGFALMPLFGEVDEFNALLVCFQ